MGTEHGALPELDSASCAPEADRIDWDELRKLSLRPGGFGEQRVALWPRLLNVDITLLHDELSLQTSIRRRSAYSSDHEHMHADMKLSQIDPVVDYTDTDENVPQVVEPHPDERQVRLDTDRSFVLYPVAGDATERESRQNELHELIVSVLRKRRRLNYFQGYHDIVSVLFLTLPKELQLACAEKLSLHRVRDSMSASLEPVVGLLRVLKRVLALADPEFASRLNRHTPLPYYSLSNLLTLLSHDVPTLPLIQHVFDYLLSRPPIIVVYLAAAIILTRKHEVHVLEQEGEDGMIHSLLSGLPDLFEEYEEKPLAETEAPATSETPNSELSFDLSNVEKNKQENPDRSSSPAERELSEKLVDDTSHDSEGSTVPEADLHEKILVDEPEEASEDAVAKRKNPEASTEQHTHASEPSDATTAQPLLTAAEEPQDEGESKPVPGRWDPSDSEEYAPRPRISLTWLLERSDELYHLHPPSHPSVGLSTIMGPQSAMCTWSEKPSELPTDNEAELMVTQPHLIVLPTQPEEMETKEEAESEHDQPHRRRRRRLHKVPKRVGPMMVERKAVVASAVLVLGVAMAIYGLQTRPERHHGGARQELKRLSRLFGGFVLGTGERLWDGLVAMSG